MDVYGIRELCSCRLVNIKQIIFYGVFGVEIKNIFQLITNKNKTNIKLDIIY